ncbi:ribonucleotide reductase large subunit [Brochothrix phage BtpYZU04]|uniref:Gp125 n=1 Tax=Brochothrix phage A9 TaxID=857312 RepID=D9J0S2_9CAUD|nr:ribonucleotide reductase large subunit [Brochothrix phage A9]ADJ53159.1 gp125 [Brochothrix phage A9]
MEQPVKQKQTEQLATYYRLNAEMGIPVDGRIQLEKDKEAVRAYFLEHINPNTVYFTDLKEKMDYLLENNYLDKEKVNKYTHDEVKELYKQAHAYKFRFQTFMGAHKFFVQYSLKTNDGGRYLGRFEDHQVWQAMYFADGDFELASKFVDLLIKQEYVPATPTMMNALRARAGEMVSCYLIDVNDDMLSISRAVNSSLQLSRLGGGVGEMNCRL